MSTPSIEEVLRDHFWHPPVPRRDHPMHNGGCYCGWQCRQVFGESKIDQYNAHLADAIRAHLAEHTDEAAGAVEQWTCPDCAFTFDAGHTDPDGGYSCPACAEHRALALADEWERDDEESLNTFGQHLMGGSVLSCAEYLRAALAGGASGAEGAGER